MKTRKCKLCDFTVESNHQPRLTQHWQDEHPQEYAKVSKWLTEVEQKIKEVERPAFEGMKGYK